MSYIVMSMLSSLFFFMFLTNASELVKIDELKIIQRYNVVTKIVTEKFRCPIEGCDASYNKLASLYAHKNRHHGNYTYPCPWCKNRIYVLSDSRLRHITRHHDREYKALKNSGRKLENLVISNVLARPKLRKLDDEQEELLVSGDEAIDIPKPMVKTEIKRERAAKIKALKFIKRCVYELNNNKEYESERPHKKFKIKKVENVDTSNVIELFVPMPIVNEQEQSMLFVDLDDYCIVEELQKDRQNEAYMSETINLEKELNLFYDQKIKNEHVY